MAKIIERIRISAFVFLAVLFVADLIFADLSDAYLKVADLSEAELTGAILKGVRASRATIWPRSYSYAYFWWLITEHIRGLFTSSYPTQPPEAKGTARTGKMIVICSQPAIPARRV